MKLPFGKSNFLKELFLYHDLDTVHGAYLKESKGAIAQIRPRGGRDRTEHPASVIVQQRPQIVIEHITHP